MAGLSRIAYGTHRHISKENDDLFIISASPIPGNDKLVSRVINQLFRKGVEVIYEDLEDIHVSGHAYKEELKLIHTLTKPKYFMPVHGEYRHLKHHSDLAIKLGMDKSNVFTKQGCCLEFIVNTKILEPLVKKMGDCSYLHEEWNSPCFQYKIYNLTEFGEEE